MARGTYGGLPIISGNEVVIPRLRSMLEKGSKRPLTLIIGPAGSGKTTLAAWYARMLANRPGWDVSWVNASSIRSVEDLSAVIPGDLSTRKTQYLLAVDDAHLLFDGGVVGYLGAMAQEGPENLHIMLVGLRNPGVRLYQLRIEDRVVEICRDDLVFDEADVEKFFKERQIPLSADRVKSIADATNGWAAGLQMIALLARESSDPDRVLDDPAAGIPWIADFLREEVLPNLDAVQLEFISRTCALDFFNRDLCVRVTGSKASGQIIEQLEALNLIISAPARGAKSKSWLRYHPLFIESLRQSMFADTSADQARESANRAICWFEEEGCFDLAIKAALSYGEYERAFELMADHLYPMLTSVDSSTLPQWLEEMPHPGEKDEHLFFLVNAWANFISGKTKRAEIWLRKVEECSDRTDLADYRGTSSVYRAVKIGSMVFSGDYRNAVELGSTALDNLGGPQLFLRCTIMHNMGEALQRLGRYREAYEYFARAKVNAEISGRRIVELLCACEISWLQYAGGEFDAASNTILRELAAASDEEKMSSWAVGLLYASLARIHLRWSDLSKATNYLDRAFELLGPKGNRDAYVEARVIAAEKLMVEGRFEDAYDILIGVYELIRFDKLPRGVSLLALVTYAENLCLLGQCDKALVVLEELRAEVNADDRFYVGFASLIEAHAWLIKGELDKAEGALESLGCATAAPGVGVLQRPAAVARACLLRAQGDKAAALDLMSSALEEGSDEAHVYAFTYPLPYADSLLYDIAHPVGENLVLMKHRGEAKRFAQQILKARGVRSMPAVAEVEETESPADVVLSKREQEIYELLKKGKTRKQISEELGIQLNTTRTHIRNIYQKTGIHDRSML